MPETHGVFSWRGPGDAPQGTVVRPRIVSGYCKRLVRRRQGSLASTVFSWSGEVIKVGAMMNFPAKLLMWHAIVSIGPA